MKGARKRLIATLCDGVFSAIDLVRQGSTDLLRPARVNNMDGFWTLLLDDVSIEDIAFYERLVEDNALWARFELEHLHVRNRNHTPMTVFDAYPELSAAAALDRASCNDMILRQLRALAQKFTGEREFKCDDSEIHGAFGAWNRATDKNLDSFLTRRRKVTLAALAQFRLLPAVWLVPLAIAPLVSGPALPFGIGCAVVGGLMAVVNHLRCHHTTSRQRRLRDAFFSETRDLSGRIRLAATLRYTQLTGLMEKALEMSKQPLARRHERSASRDWNIAMVRWKAIADHLAARIQALRQVMATHIGLHEVIYRGACDWAAYLDVYDNLPNPVKAMESHIPAVPRSFGRSFWWLTMTGLAAALSLFDLNAGLTGPQLVLAGGGLAGFVLACIDSLVRSARVGGKAAVDAEFVKVRIGETVTAEVRREVAETYEHEVGELIRLLAEWTHPDTDRPYRA